MMKGYYEDENIFKYVDEFGIAQIAYKKDAPMFEHQRQPERSKREEVPNEENLLRGRKPKALDYTKVVFPLELCGALNTVET